MGEETEQYLIRVSQNGQVIRETRTNGPTWHYDDSVQLADGLAGAALISVAQVSASYGIGPAASVVI